MINASPIIATLNMPVKPMTAVVDPRPSVADLGGGEWSSVNSGTRWSDAQLGPKITAKKNRLAADVKLSSEKDLDRLPQSHPSHAALPNDNQERHELWNLAPKSRKYVYIMIDSGASINAAKLSKHFHVARLFESEGRKKGEVTETATDEKN